MPDETDPPRKVYGFKPREFETANEPRQPASDAAPPTRDPGIVPASAGPIDVRELTRQATGQGPALSTTGPVNRANEVHAMLQDNLARANAAGLNELAPKPKRRSRRTRDYWLLMTLGNLALAILGITQRDNPFILVGSLAGIGFLSALISWIMWHVMDDY